MAANVEKSFIMQRYGSLCFLIKATIGLQSGCIRRIEASLCRRILFHEMHRNRGFVNLIFFIPLYL